MNLSMLEALLKLLEKLRLETKDLLSVFAPYLHDENVALIVFPVEHCFTLSVEPFLNGLFLPCFVNGKAAS